MNIRVNYQMKKIKLVSLLCSSLWLLGCTGEQVNSSTEIIEQPSTPNILFIYTDDQAPWALGNSGNKQAFTPNMDLLAKEGMMFPNAYTTTPVCSPSRAGLLTSRYGYELGIDDWINVKFKNNDFTELEPDLGLDTKYETWPEVLQQAGYYTGLIGKWHLGEQAQHHPTKQGYNEFTGFIGGGTKPENPTLEKNGVEEQRQGLTADLLTDEAIAFLQNHQNKKFALSLHYRAPHTKWLPVAEEDAAPYNDIDIQIPNPGFPDLDVKKTKRMMKEYLSSVRSIDRNLGRLLAKLDELKLNKNTLIVFTSDHGYNMGHNGIWHKGNGHWLLKTKTAATKNIPSNQRPNMYDNSLKVPLIVRWPSVVPAAVKNLSTVSNLDWFPTLVDVAQGKASENTIIRGKSFYSALLGKEVLTSTDYYGAYSTKHQSRSAMRMYSDGNYKLVKDYLNKGRDEFYDLNSDPAESKNLIATNKPELQIIINRFDDIIFKKMLATNDPELAQFFGE